MALWSLLLLLYNVYIGYAIHYNRARGKSLEWCNGIGFIIIITAVAYVCLVYFKLVKPWIQRSQVQVALPAPVQRVVVHRLFKVGVTVVVFLSILLFLVLDTLNDRYRSSIIKRIIGFFYTLFN